MALNLYRVKGLDVLVWNKEEIKLLRKTYRITGKLVGSHPLEARQNRIFSVPLYLTPEEVTLLLEKEFAALYEEDTNDIEDDVISNRKKEMEDFYASSLEEQRIMAFEMKKNDILSRASQIVDGIAKKQGVNSITDEERNKILDGIISGIQPIKEEHMLVQQPAECPWKTNLRDSLWSYPLAESEKLRYLVYKALWQQRYFITCGAKFGGDFLVYPGDPELYHAKFIAICYNKSKPLVPADVVLYARLASNVKKTVLICQVNTDTEAVHYTTLKYNTHRV